MIFGERIDHGGSSWSRDEDIAFERALAIYSDEDNNRFEMIASVLPGKTIEQVVEHYNLLVHDVMMIESGCVPLPDYGFSEETNANELSILQECDNNGEHKEKSKSKLKQKRKKGVAWTENEHRLFLLGLEEYGKGDWRSISRNCVMTRTPTQVASHAQKHFARLNSKNKNKKRRSSIHDEDITSLQNTHQATSQQPSSFDFPILLGTTSSLNTQGTTSSQQPSSSLDRLIHDTTTMWNTQATLQPSVNVLSYSTPTIGQSVVRPVHSPTIGQSMVRPMHLPFGSDHHMNHLAPHLMPYEVQDHVVPSAPSNNMGSIPYNMGYTHHSRII